MSKIGYARVSTKGQCDDSQVDELNAYGVDRLFVDHGVTGKHASRPELDKALEYLLSGRRVRDHAHVPCDAVAQAHARAGRRPAEA